jgi:predicted nuclease of restriction endonuclease-like (RecB) superfamily
MNKNIKLSKDNTYSKIKNILKEARSFVYKNVNIVMVKAYWNIGKIIVEEEQKGKKRASYGKYLIKELSKKLTNEFGKGFDERNLRSMRQFYSTFPIRCAVRSELTWTHYRLLLKVEKNDVRKFYINECIENNWSTRQLERQINSFYYERLLSSRDKKAIKKAIKDDSKKIGFGLKLKDLIKDPYVLEFLDIKNIKNFKEKELEEALLDKLQEFILELGKGFSFVGRQKRITDDLDHYYIDLVFYNYILKCFVLIDLKIGKLTHQDIGQMDFYVRYFEDKVKEKSDNSTIGIILCSKKSDTIVKYSVLKENRNLFASKYKLYLPTKEELKEEIERERTFLNIK